MSKMNKIVKRSLIPLVLGVALVIPLTSGGVSAETNVPVPIPSSFISEAPVVTVFVVSGGKGTEHVVPEGSTLEKALEVSGAPLDVLDNASIPAESVVKDKQLIIVERSELDSVEKTVVDNFSTSKKEDKISCTADWDTPRVLVAGENGERVESWARVVTDGEVKSEKKVSEVVNKTPVNEVTADCAPKPTPTPTPTPVAPEPKVVEVAPETRVESNSSKKVETASAPVAKSVPSENSSPALSGGKYDWMKAAGIAESDWTYVDFIVNRESGWNPNAKNSSSGACGLVQALPCSKLGGNWNDPVTALKWQKNYVEDRYGSYSQAYNFWTNNHWY